MKIRCFALLLGISLSCHSALFVPNRAEDELTFVYLRGDTLSLVTCADHIYNPLGPIESKMDLQRTQLGESKIDSIQRGEYTFYQLTYKSSYFILFLDSGKDGERSAYVQKAELVDTGIILEPGINIGISLENFLTTFFKEYPTIWLSASIIVFESCLGGSVQTYTFKNSKLTAVMMECTDCIPEFQFRGRVAG